MVAVNVCLCALCHLFLEAACARFKIDVCGFGNLCRTRLRRTLTQLIWDVRWKHRLDSSKHVSRSLVNLNSPGGNDRDSSDPDEAASPVGCTRQPLI